MSVGRTNAHVEEGASPNYATKICCQRACELQTTNNSCLALTAENCTWTPPGTTSNLDGGGCCGANESWDGVDCLEGASICNPLCTTATCGPAYDGVAVFWSAITQFFGVNINTAPDPYNICTQVSNDLSYGFEYPVTPYNTLSLIKKLF